MAAHADKLSADLHVLEDEDAAVEQWCVAIERVHRVISSLAPEEELPSAARFARVMMRVLRVDVYPPIVKTASASTLVRGEGRVCSPGAVEVERNSHPDPDDRGSLRRCLPERPCSSASWTLPGAWNSLFRLWAGIYRKSRTARRLSTAQRCAPPVAPHPPLTCAPPLGIEPARRRLLGTRQSADIWDRPILEQRRTRGSVTPMPSVPSRTATTRTPRTPRLAHLGPSRPASRHATPPHHPTPPHSPPTPPQLWSPHSAAFGDSRRFPQQRPRNGPCTPTTFSRWSAASRGA